METRRATAVASPPTGWQAPRPRSPNPPCLCASVVQSLPKPVPPHMKMKVTVKNELADSESPTLRVSVPPWFSPSPKLTKTERKERGAQNSRLLHQQLTTTKTDRSVTFPSLSVLPSVGRGSASSPLCVSVPLWFSPSQNGTKRNEMAGGSKIRALCISSLQNPKPNDRSVFRVK